MIPSPTIVIRLATLSDGRTLSNLAALDSRHPLAGPAMLAEVDGIVRAALDLSDGSVAADPFVRTAEVVEMLRLRARRLHDEQPTTSLRDRIAVRLRLRRPRAAMSGRA
jgi:aspartate carbamoyltransferase catalytic subunit